MPPTPHEVVPAGSPLVARCLSFEEAAGTVDRLCAQGLPDYALVVVADGPEEPGPGIVRTYYVISDERYARRARRLLRAGADTQGARFGVQATPCVGLLPAPAVHPSTGSVTIRRRRRWALPRSGTP